MRKVLWLVGGSESEFVSTANYIRAQALCIRTTNSWLSESIHSLKSQGFDVYAWRWPSVKVIPPNDDDIHLYALNEAQFALGLIAPGLDGYIVDPECDHQTDHNCWNDKSLGPLANQFCDTIKLAGRKKNPKFLFGTTSGGTYPGGFPDIPWPEFVAHSDVLFPQCYWYGDEGPEHGGTPQSSYSRCIASWKTIAPPGMRIVPIIGQIAKIKAAEIASYQDIIATNGITELHFYSFEPNISQDRLDAMRALGTTIPSGTWGV